MNSILLSGDVILLIVNDALWQSPDGGSAWSVLRDEDVTAVAASPYGGRNS